MATFFLNVAIFFGCSLRIFIDSAYGGGLPDGGRDRAYANEKHPENLTIKACQVEQVV